MRTLVTTGLVLTLWTFSVALAEDAPPELPAPQKEHQWLKQFVGEWDTQMECSAPGQPEMKSKGRETARMVGGFWMVAEGNSEIMGLPVHSVLTLGYDPEKRKYVGTWVDSMSSYIWQYEGTVDPTGKILTLETEGPSPISPGERCKFKEVTEFKSPDHRVFTSSLQGKDGKWSTMVTVESRRKKATAGL